MAMSNRFSTSGRTWGPARERVVVAAPIPSSPCSRGRFEGGGAHARDLEHDAAARALWASAIRLHLLVSRKWFEYPLSTTTPGSAFLAPAWNPAMSDQPAAP
jgi:hypothetical protein